MHHCCTTQMDAVGTAPDRLFIPFIPQCLYEHHFLQVKLVIFSKIIKINFPLFKKIYFYGHSRLSLCKTKPSTTVKAISK